MTAREWLRSPEAVEVAAQVINDEGGQPGHSLHSWRCEYPDRYGKCTCVRDTADILLTALLDRMPDSEEAWDAQERDAQRDLDAGNVRVFDRPQDAAAWLIDNEETP